MHLAKEADLIGTIADSRPVYFQKGLSVNGGRGDIGITLDV